MSTQDTSTTRRELLQGVGTGLVAALATTRAGAAPDDSAGAGAGGGAAAQPVGADPPLKNPVTEYPHPPFPRQYQPWPGLQSKMTPVPDDGAETYRGAGRLQGRKALVTGGDSGIGRATAIAFAREGADVAINYLPAEEPDARQVVAAIRESGRKAVALPGDIREEAFCRKLVADAARELDGLDILVNNAGRQVSQPSILDISTEQFDDTFKTNVYAMFWITKAAIPHMRPGAAIVNTASVNAYDPSENIIDYSATKGAIAIFTKGLAKQLAKHGIRVNAVAPGPVWTPLQVSGGQTLEKVVSFGGDTPLGRPGQPAELAPIYVFLASPQSSFATGQVYAAVGGRGGP